MSEQDNIRDVLDEMEGLLDFLFIGGLHTVQKDMPAKVQALAEKSGRYGLTHGASLLGQIARHLEERRHAMEYDYTKLADGFCRLNLYIATVKSRLDLKAVEVSLANFD